LFKTIKEDIKTARAKDPAARNTLEILLFYPGLHARWGHRVANFLWRHGFCLTARLVSHINRFLTHIEIHPGATIGRRFFIDHGSGVVIGETTVIEEDVLLYQGVVLGGTSLKKGKRHPTIKKGAVVGAGAICLGDITIGENAKVGAGSVVVKSVPDGATVVGIPGRVVEEHRQVMADLEHGRLPDPVAEAVRVILKEQESLEERLKKLEVSSGITSTHGALEEKIREIIKEFSQSDDENG
jgi:serine O-acetyltransferase